MFNVLFSGWVSKKSEALMLQNSFGVVDFYSVGVFFLGRPSIYYRRSVSKSDSRQWERKPEKELSNLMDYEF